MAFQAALRGAQYCQNVIIAIETTCTNGTNWSKKVYVGQNLARPLSAITRVVGSFIILGTNWKKRQ